MNAADKSEPISDLTFLELSDHIRVDSQVVIRALMDDDLRTAADSANRLANWAMEIDRRVTLELQRRIVNG
jgi:hypothetical protein